MEREGPDRRSIELQIRIVVVLYRSERRRGEGVVLDRYREAAMKILRSLDEPVAAYPDLVVAIDEARAEINGAAA